MTGTDLLDAAIGVILVILSFSLAASALSEALATALNWRGRMLRRGLFRLLEGAAGTDLVDQVFPGPARIGGARLTQALLTDPAIRVLHGPRGALVRVWDTLMGARRNGEGPGRLPSAIPAPSFARALVDTLANQVDLSGAAPGERPADVAAIAAQARQLEAAANTILIRPDGPLVQLALSPELKARLREGVGCLAAVREIRARLNGGDDPGAAIEAEIARLADQAEARLQGVLQELGIWFDRAMDRVSGWYMRRARLALFVLGVLLAAGVNADLGALGGGLMRDDGLRGTLVVAAEKRVAAGLPRPRPAPETLEDLTGELGAARAELRALPGPGFGWSCAAGERWPACVMRTVRFGAVVSWILIGLGCMMGGQVWYDVLGAVLRFRPAAGPQTAI